MEPYLGLKQKRNHSVTFICILFIGDSFYSSVMSSHIHCWMVTMMQENGTVIHAAAPNPHAHTCTQSTVSVRLLLMTTFIIFKCLPNCVLAWGLKNHSTKDVHMFLPVNLFGWLYDRKTWFRDKKMTLSPALWCYDFMFCKTAKTLLLIKSIVISLVFFVCMVSVSNHPLA